MLGTIIACIELFFCDVVACPRHVVWSDFTTFSRRTQSPQSNVVLCFLILSIAYSVVAAAVVVVFQPWLCFSLVLDNRTVDFSCEDARQVRSVFSLFIVDPDCNPLTDVCISFVQCLDWYLGLQYLSSHFVTRKQSRGRLLWYRLMIRYFHRQAMLKAAAADAEAAAKTRSNSWFSRVRAGSSTKR